MKRKLEETLNGKEELTVTSSSISNSRDQKQESTIPGMFYIDDFISKENESELIKTIDQNNWSNELSRRVQHFGYKYEYSSKKLGTKLGELPDYCKPIVEKILALEFMKFAPKPDQLIINEYTPGQGINKHVDRVDLFDNFIYSLSLGSDCIMTFGKGENQIHQHLKRRSLLIISDDARYKWTHSIASRKTDLVIEKNASKKIERERRISLTFRTIKQSAYI